MIFDELKSIGKILQEAGKIDQYSQILEVQGKLLEMQKRIIELEEENKNLREQLKFKENLTYKSDVYWIINDDKKDGPFCTRCWDKDNKLMRLPTPDEREYTRCLECDRLYTIRK